MLDATLENKWSFILNLSLLSYNVATQISGLSFLSSTPFSPHFQPSQLVNTKCSQVALTPSGLAHVSLYLFSFFPYNFSGTNSVDQGHNYGPPPGIIPLPAFCSVFLSTGVEYVLVPLPNNRTNTQHMLSYVSRANFKGNFMDGF